MPKIAYIVNEYPKVSHSFIRREIISLENLGFKVQRLAIRGWKNTLVDAQDISEQSKTVHFLNRNLRSFFSPLVLAAFFSPARLVQIGRAHV